MSLNPVYGCNPRKEKQKYEFHQHSPPILKANSTCCFVKESEKALVQWVRGAFAEVVTAWAKRCRELTAERVL